MNRRIHRARSRASRYREGVCAAALLSAAALPYALACQSASKPKSERLDPNTQAQNLATGQEVPVWGGERIFRLGERAEAAHYAMSFSDVKECEIEPYFKVPEGKMRLGVEVTIEGAGTAEVPVNPFYASLVSENGASYESSLAGCKPSLDAERVTKGKQVSGWVSFEIPRNLVGLKMIYRPVIIGAGTEELRFDLGPTPARSQQGQ